MKRYLMYKSIMKYLTDKDLSLNAKGFLSMILFNDEINALELSKYCSDDIETIKDTMLELRIMKYVKYDPETNMLLAGPSRYDEWDDSIIEDLHNKALNIKVKALEKQNKEQKKKIIELDKLAEHFKESADKFMGLYYSLKDKFDKFIKFIAERLLNPKTKDKYKEFTGDLFGHGVLTYNDSNEIDKEMKTVQIKEEKQLYTSKTSKEKEKLEL